MYKQNVKIASPESYDIENERKSLVEFLEENNLATDSEFIQKITAGDIIEVYAIPDNIQIYQNQEFAKICSYTAEQMSTIPFPKLFWRAPTDHTDLMRRASHVMLNEKKCVPWGLASHDLVESLHPRKRTFEMSMGFISPCFDKKTLAPRAWASTLKVNLIFEWQENLA